MHDIAALMKAIPFRQPVRISDFRRNILGTWRAGELRDAVAQLSIISTTTQIADFTCFRS